MGDNLYNGICYFKVTMNDTALDVWEPRSGGSYLKTVKSDPVYGPINSRRLGLSLGINPIQGGFACNWNCSYCQYGIDDIAMATLRDKRVRFTKLAEIESALIERLQSSEHFDSITICGPTEPVLHPQFDDLVDLVVRIRDVHRPGVPTSLFTNATRIRSRNLRPLDFVFLKLDAGNEPTFERFNRPRGIEFWEYVDELKNAPVDKKIIQTMIADGADGNYAHADIGDYLEIVGEISPSEVHLYSILYQPRLEFDLKPVDVTQLDHLARKVEARTDAKVSVFSDPVEMGREFRF